jgi:hypothetical protein
MLKGISTRSFVAIALAAGWLGASVCFVACSSSNAAAPASSVSTAPGSCPNPTIQIDFPTMYSAYIPGSTSHTFQIPAVTHEPATWSVSDPSQVQLAAQTFDSLSGVMITVQGPGTGGKVTVYATNAAGACGASVLNITANTEDDWQIGNKRYNDGVSLHFGPGNGPGGGGRPDGGFHRQDGGSFFERDGGTACTNCHGPTAVDGPFKDVSHTPEQTGGFSDQELIQIITQGIVPPGGYFDPTVIDPRCDNTPDCTTKAMARWQSFHRWSDITSDQYVGVISYLRSLQPEGQTGTSNFHRRDGGG